MDRKFVDKITKTQRISTRKKVFDRIYLIELRYNFGCIYSFSECGTFELWYLQGVIVSMLILNDSTFNEWNQW